MSVVSAPSTPTKTLVADGLTGGLSPKQVAMLLAYATLMMGVCLLACVVPTRRALGVEPTIALRMD